MTRRHRTTSRRHDEPHSLGLALGGGAARGYAHIPVLEALDDLGLRPKIIAGTSIGAILGAVYASGASGKEIREFATALFAKRTEVMRRLATNWPGNLMALWNPFTPAMLNGETLLGILMPESLPRDFADLEIPFIAVATDFYAQEQVLFDDGPLIPAIAASASLPALMKPVAIDGRILIDGGFVNPTPFDIIAPKVDLTLAVDVTGGKGPRATGKMPNSVEAWVGAAQITLHSIVEEKLLHAAPDILIRPDVTRFAVLDFFKIKDILAAAEPAKEETKRRLDAYLTATA
ncbi:MAG: patatin-like phospholipase family protein [Hyphomicrobiaceae bacterium]